ncbi:hypothetical protein AKJ16_DCAP12108 [Drosera capensis]
MDGGKKDGNALTKSSDDCSICLESDVHGNRLVKLPCHHRLQKLQKHLAIMLRGDIRVWLIDTVYAPEPAHRSWRTCTMREDINSVEKVGGTVNHLSNALCASFALLGIIRR